MSDWWVVRKPRIALLSTVKVVSVEQALIDEACAGLEVFELAPFRDGGQKTVRLVERDGVHYVLKVIQSGSTDPLALQRAAREVDHSSA